MALKKCSGCGKEISKSTKVCPHCGYKKKDYGCLFLLVFIALVIIFFVFITPSPISTMTETKKVEFIVQMAVEDFLKENLKDPKSYQSINWGELREEAAGGYTIEHTYRAKNSFGGYAVEKKLFYITAAGKVAIATDAE